MNIKVPPIYRNDMIHSIDTYFEYPIPVMPIKKLTTEKELYKLAGAIPTEIHTYQRSIIRKIHGQNIEYNRIVYFMDVDRKSVYEEINGGRQIVRGSDLLEIIDLTVFIKNGIVQDYVTSHFKSNANGEGMIPGKYNEYAKGERKEVYPGGEQDLCLYTEEKWGKTGPDYLHPFGDCVENYPFKFKRGEKIEIYPIECSTSYITSKEVMDGKRPKMVCKD